MAWLSNGIALRKAAQVFGASCSSKRAWNVKSPAWTMSWSIQDTRDALRRDLTKKQVCSGNYQKQGTFQPAGKILKAFDARGERIKRVRRFGKSRAYSSGLFLS